MLSLEQARLVRGYGKFLSTPERIESLKKLLEKAWADKTPGNDPQRVTSEARENIAKVFRQWVTSFVDQYATELAKTPLQTENNSGQSDSSV